MGWGWGVRLLCSNLCFCYLMGSCPMLYYHWGLGNNLRFLSYSNRSSPQAVAGSRILQGVPGTLLFMSFFLRACECLNPQRVSLSQKVLTCLPYIRLGAFLVQQHNKNIFENNINILMQLHLMVFYEERQRFLG